MITVISTFFQKLHYFWQGLLNYYHNKGDKDAVFNLFFAFSVIFAVTWYAWIYFLKPRRTTPPLPPGPPAIPFFGNLLSLDPELHSYFADLARNYGPILTLRLGSKVAIVVSSPSLAREVLKDQDITFANRDVPAAGRAAAYGGSDIV